MSDRIYEKPRTSPESGMVFAIRRSLRLGRGGGFRQHLSHYVTEQHQITYQDPLSVALRHLLRTRGEGKDEGSYL